MSQTPFQPDDELLSAYIDGELSADELRAVEEWIATDPAAQALVEELRNVSNTVQSLPRTAVPAEWTAQLAQRLDEATSSKTSLGAKHEENGQAGGIASLPIGRSKRGWWWSAAAIAAAVAVMAMLPQANLNDQVAKNTPTTKAPAAGSELARAPMLEGTEGERMTMSAPPSDGAAAPSLDALATEDLSADMPTPPEFAPEATPERADFARMAEAPLAATAEPTAPVEPVDNTYLIVWCEVPPETLRQREINNVLGDNGIQIDDRTESWLAAAEPVRQQIAMRNRIAVENSSGPRGRVRSVEGTASRESAAASTRSFAPAEATGRSASPPLAGRNQPTTSDAGVGQENDLDERDRDNKQQDEEADAEADESVEIEGETILVDATADQIASCLAAMQNDPGNYASITVEPVSKQAIAEQLIQNRRGGAAAGRAGLSLRMGVQDGEQNADDAATVDLADSMEGKVAMEAQAANEAEISQQVTELQVQRPQARRLQRPKDWYYYNTAPQDDQQGIPLPVYQDANSKVAAEDKTLANGKTAKLEELNRLVKQQQQVRPQQSLQAPLKEQQPVQVLFVLRNSRLSNPALSAGPATASEIAPAEAMEASPAPASESP
ncbi:hypothetical protein NG895_08745 [Aeoliella sp. ICT_H6.2]|uniref:Zinc-finger domain-containing protein n=1 Tax=Aeoliella straminimaris TaxID=2954799 RepID=A0A9X2JIJ3_9BACT|nr:zf-HC2 domain-containing protein [Aeoliella straminimaris]MCO6043994.1 hypothetical protein [Aeoliella straminimaris]